MWVSRITKDDLTNDVIDRLLFEGLNDNGASVDCIIVLGSMKAAKYRVPAAAKAFFLEGLKRSCCAEERRGTFQVKAWRKQTICIKKPWNWAFQKQALWLKEILRIQ